MHGQYEHMNKTAQVRAGSSRRITLTHSAINRTQCASQRLAPQEARTVCFVEDNPEGRSAHVSMCCKGLGEDYERSSAVQQVQKEVTRKACNPGSCPSRSN
jgi:hypothetical protein